MLLLFWCAITSFIVETHFTVTLASGGVNQTIVTGTQDFLNSTITTQIPFAKSSSDGNPRESSIVEFPFNASLFSSVINESDIPYITDKFVQTEASYKIDSSRIYPETNSVTSVISVQDKSYAHSDHDNDEKYNEVDELNSVSKNVSYIVDEIKENVMRSNSEPEKEGGGIYFLQCALIALSSVGMISIFVYLVQELRSNSFRMKIALTDRRSTIAKRYSDISLQLLSKEPDIELTNMLDVQDNQFPLSGEVAEEKIKVVVMDSQNEVLVRADVLVSDEEDESIPGKAEVVQEPHEGSSVNEQTNKLGCGSGSFKSVDGDWV